MPRSAAERKETVSTVTPFAGAVALSSVSPCPLLLRSLRATGSLRTPAQRQLQGPGGSASPPSPRRGPRGGEPLHPAGPLCSEPFGRGRSGGIAVGDRGGFFCRGGGLSVPFLFSLFFPPCPSPESLLFPGDDKFYMTLDFLCPARRPCF